MSLLRIDKQNADALKKWFANYVQGFNLGNDEWQQNIILKKQHTNRVCTEILHIGEYLELNESELRFAEIIALFHDIGRFEQYARYKTFVDSKSENHAELGVKILEETKVLKNLDDSAQQIIFRAILYHNRSALPEDENEQILFFTKLLRDADKLDIYKVVTDYYQQPKYKRNSAIELDLPDTAGISAAVYQDLIHRRIVDIQHVHNLNDFKMLQIGWVFDINFSPTFQFLKERGYLQIIQHVLPESQQIKQIFIDIQQFLNDQIESAALEAL